MRARLIICGAVAVATPATVPALAATAHPAATTVPPACVVVNGPSGASIQVGFAPGGPAGCTTLP